MLVISWREFLEKELPIDGNNTSMTVGVFDGVHLGHQALIKKIVSHNDKTPAVVTFAQNHKTHKKPDILSFRQKIAIFENLGVKILLAVDFTESFKRMSGIEFLEILLKQGNIGFFAAGNSFRCGYQLDTGAAEIKKFFSSHNIPVEILPDVMEGSLPISSSRIRSAIANGDLKLAEAMLGRPTI